MKDNWLEKGLNDKLGDYGSSIDFEKAWKAIEEQRQPKKRKPRFLGWWFSGLVCLISISGFFYWGMSYSAKPSTTLDRITIEQKAIPEVAEKKKVQTNPTDQSISFSKNDTANSNIAFSNVSQSIETSISNNKNAIAKKTKTIILRDKIKNIEKSIRQQPNEITNGLYRPISSEVSNQASLISDLKERSTLATSDIPTGLKTNTSNLQQLPTINISLLNSVEKFSTTEIQQAIKTINKTPNFAQYIGIESGYGFRSKGKTLNDESPLDVISLNLYYQKYFNKNFYIKTGLNLNQFTNELESNSIKSCTQILDDQVIIVNNYKNGVTEEIYGTAEVEFIEKTNAQLFNRYQSVSVPLLVGIEIAPLSRNSFQIEAGVSAVLASQYNGFYFDNSGSETLSKLETLDFRKNGIINSLYAFQWNYAPIKNYSDLDFFLKYQGSFQVNNISSSANLNIEKFRAHQLFVGLRYQL